MGWRFETLNEKIDEELAQLPVDMRANFARIVELLEEFGIEAAREPHVKNLGQGVFEIRMKGASGISRALYGHLVGSRFVVVLVFVKKSTATPKQIIALAVKRLKGAKR